MNMSKLITQLSALEESLRTADGADADSFSRVFGEFLTLAETTKLMDVSKPSKDRGMRAILEAVARRYAEDPALVVTGMQMLHHAPTKLFQGNFFVGSHPATFFYFARAKQGIAAFHAGGSMMHYYRLSAIDLPPDGLDEVLITESGETGETGGPKLDLGGSEETGNTAGDGGGNLRRVRLLDRGQPHELELGHAR
jgi:hypothetical protein